MSNSSLVNIDYPSDRLAPNAKDLSGLRVGRLSVTKLWQKRPYRGSTAIYWRCICDCGEIAYVAATSLAHDHTKSCGCAKLDGIMFAQRTHGQSRSATYNSWRAMTSRCTYEKDKSYKYYGGRGIRICEKWQAFEGFMEDMGECPKGLTLERRDSNANYEPDNCIWVTRTEQTKNKSNSRVLTIDGVSKTLGAWAKEIGRDRGVIRNRLNAGWSHKDAVMRPPRSMSRKDGRIIKPLT